MKKILFISYYFPPDRGVGGLRIARFSKYLPLYGWRPFVLTTRDRYREGLDRERLKGLERIEIFKTMELPTLKDFYLKVKGFLDSRRRSMVESESARSAVEPEDQSSRRETVVGRLKRYFISLFVLLPDEKRGWILPAAVKAIREIKRRKIDCVMTSSPPHSAHLVGLLVKKWTGVTWVADFRDPWTDLLACKSDAARSALSDRIERWMEKEVVRRADRIIVTTEALKAVFQERYPGAPREKFLYITNGIDQEEFDAHKRPEKYKTFTITYAGTLYFGRTPEPLFKAIQGLISEGKIDPSGIRVKLVGDCQFIDGRPTIDLVQSCGLDKVVEISEAVPYPEALQMIRRSHLLLLIATPLQRLCVPAKFYDYFGAGTEILALTEEGATSELIQKTGNGVCFSPRDIQGISGYIGAFIDRIHDLPLNLPNRFDRFDMRYLTKDLSDALTMVKDS
ncbi:MAG TPA: glycosyltransferase family 4 protein [Candidatus Manganitrophaceae bacterium]